MGFLQNNDFRKYIKKKIADQLKNLEFMLSTFFELGDFNYLSYVSRALVNLASFV